MASGSVLRVRNEIEEKLSSKRLELEETLKEIKKYGGVMGKGKIHNRLGLAMGHGQADRRRVAILSRLGPKVTDEDADPCQQQPIVQEEIEEEEEEEDDDEDAGPAAARLVSSRVVVEHKSRQQILNQQTSRNQEEMQRNKRIFNSLLFGHLAKFRKDETKVKEREQKKREVEKKIELRTELEKQEADKKKRQLAQEQRTKQQELKVLQVQMRRVEQFEEWEQNKKNQLHFIRTKTLLPLFFLPKEHNDATLTALEDTMDVVESEIRQARAKFEEDLLRIESRAKNVATGQNLESESEEDEDESKQQKYRSVIVVQHNQNLSDGAGHDEEIASDPHQRGSSPHDENQSLEDQPSAHHQFIRGDSSRDRTEDQEHFTSHHLSTDSRFSKRTNEHETMEREADDHPRQETNEQPPSPVQQTELAQENRKKLKRGHDALLESRNGNKAPYSEGAPAKNVTRESAAKRKRGQSSDRGRKTRSSSSSSSSSDSSSSSASSSSSSSSSSDSSDDEESRKKVKSGSSQRKMSSKAATSKRK